MCLTFFLYKIEKAPRYCRHLFIESYFSQQSHYFFLQISLTLRRQPPDLLIADIPFCIFAVVLQLTNTIQAIYILSPPPPIPTRGPYLITSQANAQAAVEKVGQAIVVDAEQILLGHYISLYQELKADTFGICHTYESTLKSGNNCGVAIKILIGQSAFVAML